MIVTIQYMMIVGDIIRCFSLKKYRGKKYLRSETERKLHNKGKHSYLRLSLGTVSSESRSL